MKYLEIDAVLRLGPETQQSFDKLVGAGMDRQELGVRLCMIPFLPSKPVTLIPNKTRKTIRNFPKQIEKWAQAIEVANARGILYNLAISTWVEAHNPTAGDHRRRRSITMLDTFELLPKNLRAYADYWRHVIAWERKGLPAENG